MKIKNIIALIAVAVELIFGFIFVMNGLTDIQLGFGIVLLTQGIIHLTR